MSLQLLRNLFVGALLCCSFLFLLGCSFNPGGSKYTRTRHSSCGHAALSLGIRDSLICCDDPEYSTSWICVASFDQMNSLLSGPMAFILPLLPCIANALHGSTETLRAFKRFVIYIGIIIIRMVCFVYFNMSFLL